MDEALLDQEIERTIDRDRREPAPTGRRYPVSQIIGADRAVIGMERFQRLPPDRRQAQAPFAADPLGPSESLRRMASVILGVAAAVPVMCVVHMVVMHMRV